jgi:hypothetical protein
MRRSMVCMVVGAAMSACAPASSGERPTPHSDDKGVKIVNQPSNQSSTLDKVKQWAGPGATVSSYEDVKVPAMELFSVLAAPPAGVVQHDYTPPRRGVAAQRGGATIVEGKAAMQAAMDAGMSAPEDIARLALLFLHDGGELVTGGEGAAPPGFQGRRFVYYWRTSDMGRQLMKSQLDLGALTVTTEPGVPRPDPVEEARATLASGSQIVWRTAIGQLKALCVADASARALLLDTARTHADAATRAQAAEAAGACKSPEAIAPLAEVLDKDPIESVRAAAAMGLGAIGGERAAAALEAAQPGAKGDTVRRAIAFALAQLARGTP